MIEENNQELEIDLVHLIRVLLRKWWLILSVTAVFTVLVGLYSYLYLDDTYTSESSMIVQVTNSGDSEYQDLLIGERLVGTYSEITKSAKVLNELKANLNLDLTNGRLRDMITVEGVQNTLIVKLQVESNDPDLAADIANELVVIVQELGDSYEGLESVEVLDTAIAPNNPSGPNRLLYMAVGILLGGMVGSGAVLAIEFLDKKLKTPKDIERVLGLRLLGTIPDYVVDEGVEE